MEHSHNNEGLENVEDLLSQALEILHDYSIELLKNAIDMSHSSKAGNDEFDSINTSIGEIKKIEKEVTRAARSIEKGKFIISKLT